MPQKRHGRSALSEQLYDLSECWMHYASVILPKGWVNLRGGMSGGKPSFAIHPLLPIVQPCLSDTFVPSRPCWSFSPLFSRAPRKLPPATSSVRSCSGDWTGIPTRFTPRLRASFWSAAMAARRMNCPARRCRFLPALPMAISTCSWKSGATMSPSHGTRRSRKARSSHSA